MEGMRGAGNEAGVTQSMLSGQKRTNGELSGSVVTHADVTQSLRFQLKPALPGHEELSKFKATHSLGPDLRLSEKFAAIEEGELNDEDSIYFSLTDLPDPVGSASDDALPGSSQEGDEVENDIDVMESLTPAAMQKLSSQGFTRATFSGSLITSMDDAHSGPVGAAQQEAESDDEDDSLFQSASNVMFEDRSEQDALLKKQLEQSVAMSLMPKSDEIKPANSQQLDQAWHQLTSVLAGNGHSKQINDALLQLTSLYPVVADPAKVADMLKTQVEQASSTRKGVASCQQLMGKFQLADELMKGDLTSLEQLPDHDALQILLIMRQQAIRESAGADELEKLIQARLMRVHGDQVAKLTGLNTDDKSPDYEHFKQLKETLGAVHQPRLKRHEKSSYVDKQRGISIDPNFKHVEVELSDKPVVPRTIESAVARKLLEHVTTNPTNSLSELIKLDAWLADDSDQENAVIHLVARQITGELKQKGMALGLYDDTDGTPASGSVNTQSKKGVGPGTKKRVRFSDTPDVVPRANSEKPRDERAVVDDIVELSRDPASFEIRVYLDCLNKYMQRLELQARKAIYQARENNGQFTTQGRAVLDELNEYRNDVEEYQEHAINIKELQWQYKQQLAEGGAKSAQMQALKQEIETKLVDSRNWRSRVLVQLDKALGKENRALQTEARKQRVSHLPFIKAGLVDKEKFLEFHEDQLAQMVMKTIDVAYSKATGEQLYKLEPSNQPDRDKRSYEVNTFGDKKVPHYLVSSRRKRGIPATSDIMSAVGKASRPYHQAMEINLKDPISFCAKIADVSDPGVMLALRVRMEKEQCQQPMRTNWEKRMKDVMCEYQARQILLCLDHQITADLREKFGLDRKGVPVNPRAHDDYAAKLTAVYGEQMIEDITGGEMDYPGITRAANAGMARVWNALEKPAGMPADVNKMLVNYMPTPDELLHQLEGEGLT